jgi:hypothetical protein
VDTLLLPVVQAYQNRQTQMQLDTFVTITHRFAKIRSKRLQAAVSEVSGAPLRDELAVPGGDATPAVSAPAKAARQKPSSGGKRKRATASDVGTAARRQGKAARSSEGRAARGRRRASTSSSGSGGGNSTEGGADSDDPEALLNEDGTFKVPQPEVSGDYWKDEGWDDGGDEADGGRSAYVF